MQKTLTENILQVIKSGACTTLDVIETILESGYGATHSQLNRNLRKREQARAAAEIRQAERHRFYSMLSKLKQEVLIQKRDEKWNITHRGREKYKALQTRSIKEMPRQHYKREVSIHPIIVVFDVPERERHKRNWLRAVLRNLGFTLLQKSVWIGKTKIPKSLLIELRKIGLISCVYILSIKKSGNIERLT